MRIAVLVYVDHSATQDSILRFVLFLFIAAFAGPSVTGCVVKDDGTRESELRRRAPGEQTDAGRVPLPESMVTITVDAGPPGPRLSPVVIPGAMATRPVRRAPRTVTNAP